MGGSILSAIIVERVASFSTRGDVFSTGSTSAEDPASANVNTGDDGAISARSVEEVASANKGDSVLNAGSVEEVASANVRRSWKY